MSSKYKEEMKEKFKEDVKIIKCSNVYEKFKCVWKIPLYNLQSAKQILKQEWDFTS